MSLTDKQLSTHKKASAGLSVATSTLGVTALGVAGARAGAGKGLKIAHRAGALKKVTPEAVQRFKGKSTGLQTGLLTGGAGLSGINGFNFAGIQNAESKKVRKDMSELGIWAEPIEKARRKPGKHEIRDTKTGMATGALGGAAAGVALLNPRGTARAVKAVNYGARAAGKLYKTSAPTGTLKRVGSGTRTPVRDKASGLRGDFKQTSSRVRSAAIGGKLMAHNVAATRPQTNFLTPMGGVYGGLYGAVVGGNSGAKHGRKRDRVQKGFDPERSRKKRLTAYQAGSNVAAVGLAGGAAFTGSKTLKRVKTLNTARNPKGFGDGRRGPTPISSRAYKNGMKATLTSRNAKVTAGLGLGAVGAAVAADRIKSFKRGNGRSYRPLHGQY